MTPEQEHLLKETYRLTEETNHMLHRMKRAAFWRSIITWFVYLALFIAPVWFYLTYLNGTVQELLHTYQRMQGSGSQSQFDSFRQALEGIQQKIQALNTLPSSTTVAH